MPCEAEIRGNEEGGDALRSEEFLHHSRGSRSPQPHSPIQACLLILVQDVTAHLPTFQVHCSVLSTSDATIGQ